MAFAEEVRWMESREWRLDVWAECPHVYVCDCVWNGTKVRGRKGGQAGD